MDGEVDLGGTLTQFKGLGLGLAALTTSGGTGGSASKSGSKEVLHPGDGGWGAGPGSWTTAGIA